MAHDVVISYSSKDKLQADAICHRLEERGIRCWIAPRDVGLGEYAASIVEAIEAARVMVLVFSAHANESHHVRREVERAVSKGATIVPVRLEDTEMSKSLELYVGSMHWLDALTPPLEQHIDKLAADLKALLAQKGGTVGRPAPGPPPEGTAAEKPAGKKRRSFARSALMVAGALVALLLGVIVFGPSTEDTGPAVQPAAEQAEVIMTFDNLAAVPVAIYQTDPEGQEELVGTLDPRQSSSQTTYIGQVWVVRTVEGDGAKEILACEAETPESWCVVELVTGRTVAAAELGSAGQGLQGTFRQVDDGQWVEEGPTGAVRFRFREQSRDDWTVYLYDESRDVNIQIDLLLEEILYAEGDAQPVKLADILSSWASEE